MLWLYSVKHNVLSSSSNIFSISTVTSAFLFSSCSQHSFTGGACDRWRSRQNCHTVTQHVPSFTHTSVSVVRRGQTVPTPSWTSLSRMPRARSHVIPYVLRLWIYRSEHSLACVRYSCAECLLKVKLDSLNILFWLAFLPVQSTQTWHWLNCVAVCVYIYICSEYLFCQPW